MPEQAHDKSKFKSHSTPVSSHRSEISFRQAVHDSMPASSCSTSTPMLAQFCGSVTDNQTSSSSESPPRPNQKSISRQVPASHSQSMPTIRSHSESVPMRSRNSQCGIQDNSPRGPESRNSVSPNRSVEVTTPQRRRERSSSSNSRASSSSSGSIDPEVEPNVDGEIFKILNSDKFLPSQC